MAPVCPDYVFQNADPVAFDPTKYFLMLIPALRDSKLNNYSFSDFQRIPKKRVNKNNFIGLSF